MNYEHSKLISKINQYQFYTCDSHKNMFSMNLSDFLQEKMELRNYVAFPLPLTHVLISSSHIFSHIQGYDHRAVTDVIWKNALA